MRRAYITGATGAIGMALIEKLLTEKVDVTVFVRPDSARLDRVRGLPVNVVEAGLENLKDLNLSNTELNNVESCSVKLAKDIYEVSDNIEDGVFYHLGWAGTIGPGRNDMEIQRKNVEYTLDAVRLAARLGCHCFVGAGSQAEYGPTDGILSPDTPTHPVMEYGKAKLEASIKGAELALGLGMNFRWVRILSVYGPYDGKLTMVSSVCHKLLSGQCVELTQGLQQWDYLYSKDAARALYLIGNMSKKIEMDVGAAVNDSLIYCLGSGLARPLKDYIDEICDACQADRSLLLYGAVPYGNNQVMHLQADISSLKQDTGFYPVTSFSEGIKETVDWIRNF